MHINANFDSGSIEVVDIVDARRAHLKLTDDAAGFRQWFHFRAVGVRDVDCRFEIVNAGDASFPDGWPVYQACASYDCENWFRVCTEYDGMALSISHRPARDAVYYAFAAPYSLERHRHFVASCQRSPLVRASVIGQSVEGHDIDLLRIGGGDEKPIKFWLSARQHPAETAGSWLVEGLVSRLLDPHDAVVRELLKKVTFYVLPNLNPDGTRRGFLRSNAAGVNLNREWNAPSMDRSPEVLYARDAMHKIGVDFCLDLHADASIPFVYIEGGGAAPSANQHQRDLQAHFENVLKMVNPDYQNERRYPHEPEPGEGDLSMCVYYVAETFKALSLMLEMPFGDYDLSPDEEQGWSVARSRKLGASCLDALFAVVNDLR